MLSVALFYCYAQCRYAECHYYGCCQAECPYSESRGAPNIIKLKTDRIYECS
jgi:hypothetical protein